MSTYNNVFNGNFVQPSTVSYRNIVLTSDVTLTWPTSYLDNATNEVAAQVMTVQSNATVATTLDLIADPLTSVNGSAVVSVDFPNNALFVSGTNITIAGATAFNNLTAPQLNITAAATTLDINTVEYTTAGLANANGVGGGAAVTLTYGLPFSITLPDATLVANGQSLEFINNGTNYFNVLDNDGTFLVQIPPSNDIPRIGNVFNLLLKDNSTTAGAWEVIQNGAGTTQVNATALAGLGIVSLNGTLNANIPSKIVAGDYTASQNDRGSLLIWTGGTGTINLPSINIPTPSGFSVSINNGGTGVVDIDTTDGSTIDGINPFSLNPGASSEFVFNSPNWYSLGFGTETTFQVNVLNKNIAAGGTFNLTNQEASRLVQNFTGNLAGNATVTYPAAAGQWYIDNQTTGAFSLTVQLFGVGGGIQIPQGQRVIIYSDGTNVFQTPTTATNAIFSPGTEGAPTIVFTNSATTGFYSEAAARFGFSSAANLALSLGDLGAGGIGLGIRAGGVLRFYNNANSQYIGLKAPALGASVDLNLPAADATVAGQLLRSDAATNLSFTTAAYPNATTINQILYSSAANTITGIATANSGVLVTSVGGVPSISTTIPNATQDNITRLGTIVSGVWNGTVLTVPFGGTGAATMTTAYGVICAGTTATGALQNAGAGTANQILVSNGAAALPTWQAITAIVLPAATKAQQITATSTAVYVNPGVQQYHPSASKAWAKFTWDGVSTVTILASYNIASIVNIATAAYRVTFTVPFSSANYGFSASCTYGGSGANGNVFCLQYSAAAGAPGADPTTSTFVLGLFGSTFGFSNTGAAVYISFYGEQ